jgi:hypothetical protein
MYLFVPLRLFSLFFPLEEKSKKTLRSFLPLEEKQSFFKETNRTFFSSKGRNNEPRLKKKRWQKVVIFFQRKKKKKRKEGEQTNRRGMKLKLQTNIKF